MSSPKLPPSRYLKRTVQSGEDVHAIGRIHWAMLVPACLICLIFSLVFGSVIYQMKLMLVSSWFGLLMVLPWIAVVNAIIYRETTESGITSRRVLVKTGLISRQVHELSLAKVESAVVKQGIIGRIFGYGTVEIKGTGGHGVRVDGLQDPLKFREILQQVAMV